MSTRTVVTGGAGFIGSELVRQLVAAGHSVEVVDTLVNGRVENLAGLDATRLTLHRVDVRDRARLDQVLRGTDVVFHLACLGVRHSLHAPVENHEVNATGTLILLEAARAADVARFVYVSSSEVYGTARTVPIAEDHPTRPCTVYGGSKLAGESYARAFFESYGYPTVMVRPFNAYGPRCHHEGDSGEVIPKFLLRCLAGRPMVVFGDGLQTRDFTFVADTARGILESGFSDRCIGQTINLGSGREIAIAELARAIAGVAGRPDAALVHDQPRPGDVRRLCADSSRAAELIDFAPRVGLEHGLQALLAWYRGLGVPIDALLEHDVIHNWESART